MTYVPSNIANPFVFDIDAVKGLGSEFAEQYASARPFPHIAIDDFLSDDIIDYCIANFPDRLDADGHSFDRDQERYKRSFHPDYLEPTLRNLFYAFNSRPFVTVIENITGIEGLIPDPYFAGGGFHEISSGGHLSMHADFNKHRKLGLERRVNVLIYLNRDWKDDYGGQLELWETDMSARVQSIVPLANRCVIFTTSSDSMHGNPNPVAHPDDTPRRSIALYYYTATWAEDATAKATQFRRRPGADDKIDWDVKSAEIINEFLPPVLARPALRLKHKLRPPRMD